MSWTQTYKDFKRLQQISNVLFKQELGYFVAKLKLKHNLPFQKRVQPKKFIKPEGSLPRSLRIAMEELGGSFVKLGQLLSLRPDLVPEEYIEEFSKLQDSVKPFPFEQVKATIEVEFGKPIKKIFSHFNKKPIAAASVGQVHEAILKNGDKVAVKVQRPNIRQVFETDIDLMYHLAHLIEKHIPESKTFNPVGIVEEFEKYTKKEFDYLLEARNIERYGHVIKNEKNLVVPKVYKEYVTPRVLVMEFIDGVKISEVKDFKKLKVKKSYLSNTLVKAFVKGVLYHRLFHADPHPGNILIMKNKKIALLDFGITGYLTSELADQIGYLYFAIINGDMDMIVDGLVDISELPNVDKETLKEDVREMWDLYYDVSLEEVDMTRFFLSTLEIGKRHGFKFPVQYVLLLKSMITTEGVIRKIDPNFNFVRSGKPLFKKFIEERTKPENLLKNAKKTILEFKDLLVNFPSDAKRIMTKLEEEDKEEKSFKLDDEEMKEFAHEVEKSTNRMTVGVILAAFIIASALMILAKVPPIVFGLPLYAIIGLIISLILLMILIVSVLK